MFVLLPKFPESEGKLKVPHFSGKYARYSSLSGSTLLPASERLAYLCEVDPFPQSLCNHCTHLRRIQNKRGSVFFMCAKSKKDVRFPKYRPQPVLACIGFLTRESDGDACDSE